MDEATGLALPRLSPERAVLVVLGVPGLMFPRIALESAVPVGSGVPVGAGGRARLGSREGLVETV